ncbi:MAG: NAD-dependent epimerase/dehydratase family protein [Thermodesulfovibrionales bacterium]
MLFIAGSTGFIGINLLKALKEENLRIRCLVRDDRKAEIIRSLGYEVVIGDITDPASLKGTLDDVETVVHLVGIIEERGTATFRKVHVEGTTNLINESIRKGVKRIFYQSALGTDINSPFNYLKTKAEAEEIVRSSGIPFIIFRPSLIVGEGDGFTEKMKQLLSTGPVVPVPGSGNAKFQPVYIKDWCKCFLKASERDTLSSITYEFGGPEHLTYNEILKMIMKALDINKPIVHIPMSATRLSLPFMGMIGSIASALGKEIPSITGELLSLLSIDNICEIDSIRKNFGFIPMGFKETLAEFLIPE